MYVKEFYEEWSTEEINEYLDQFGILVLFEIYTSVQEADLIIHGNITDAQADQLREQLVFLFGGAHLSKALCAKINEYAEKWHNKHVLKKKAHVVNYRRRGI